MSKVFEIRDYYCSMKFKFLKIDLESTTTYNCHAASPHSVDFNWLKNNPGNLFNTNVNVAERQMMLENKRNSSCEQNCWSAEDNGAQSPRQYQLGTQRTHSVVNTNPEIVDLTIGSDCNLTCSYCCKEYSSAWRRDLATHGNYDVQSDANRFALTVKDTVLMKFSQSALKSTLHYQSLLNEIKLVAPTLKKLIVTGGEPFLDNQLIETIRQLPFSKDCKIQMYTGLGVNVSRFEKILTRLKTVENLYLTVSAECTNQLHEFNRYGSSWLDFEHKIQLIRKHGIKYEFQSTLSNLTVFGFANFAKQFKDDTIRITFAYQPNMMAPYVLDSTSKQVIIEQLQLLPESMKNQILQSMSAEPTESQRQGIKQFLTEFVNRRKDLDITIYPKHFLNWISYVV